ncbi:GGDEF domain-containing protein [Paenibacillus arenilitoris]|uniref:GGDEF domain-containing protein n=1 Tax=Paenibacillus arenilitoris TaxID=2772299 RepID=A0A927H9P4_9BACL|nr:GGDEF domain-containing protein [Paenibacillus arenilitoris]MBD2871819.1 GGDEF domain-containing protein [Paenibacillus arenilitoris]
MQSGFKTKLMIIMGVFSILLTLVISLVNQHRLKEQLIAGFKRESSLVEDVIVTAVSDADKAFQMSDDKLEEQMRDYSERLLEHYRDNPDVASWDYDALKKASGGMDIYIIDDAQKIVHSSFAPDVGLDFRADNETMRRFAELLAERLKGDSFVADGLDQESNTGKLRKYSYVPTPDHKYLIELGLYQENNPVFQSFNFLEIGRKLAEKYSYIHEITVFTTSGKAIGKSGEDGKAALVSSENRPYFDTAYRENDVQQVKRIENGRSVAYRYVPYIVQYSQDQEVRYTDHRIVEIKYNDQELLDKLKQNNNVFLIQLLATLAIALIISFVISRLVARPLYLASHDWLTGLFNRAAFVQSLSASIAKNNRRGQTTGLLHIDLDNFKQINDELGHDAGDAFLVEVSKRIRSAVSHPGAFIARLGGDEFVVILNDLDNERTATEVARAIIERLRSPMEIKGVDVVKEYQTTASIGIALAPEHARNSNDLYNCADQALYYAKRTSKNAYCTYGDAANFDPTG